MRDTSRQKERVLEHGRRHSPSLNSTVISLDDLFLGPSATFKRVPAISDHARWIRGRDVLHVYNFHAVNKNIAAKLAQNGQSRVIDHERSPWTHWSQSRHRGSKMWPAVDDIRSARIPRDSLSALEFHWPKQLLQMRNQGQLTLQLNENGSSYTSPN